MTSRDRVDRALRHRKPDRVPIYEAFWEATSNAWHAQGLPEDASPDDYFETEIRLISVDNSFGFPSEEIERTEDSIVVRDAWGILKRDWLDHRSTPELLDFPIKSRAQWDDLKSRLVPDPSRIDWAAIQAEHAAYREQDKFVCLAAIPGYEAAWRKLGVEGLLMAIAEDPGWVRELYEYDTDMILGLAQLYLDQGLDFDGFWFWDDLGYRNAPLFSPHAYREQLLPYHKQLCDFARAHDLPTILHTCGHVMPLVPMIVEAGFDCLQAIEVKAGMDLGLLIRDYGSDLCFMGGVDVRCLFDPNEAVMESEVLEKLRLGMSNPGGYVFHSDHSIPPQVSFERYAKVIDLVRKHGVYG